MVQQARYEIKQLKAFCGTKQTAILEKFRMSFIGKFKHQLQVDYREVFPVTFLHTCGGTQLTHYSIY